MSKTYFDGSPHKDRRDKTVITRKKPGLILEQGGPCKQIVSYVMDRDGISFIEAIKKLADIAGLQVPENQNHDPEAYRKQKDRAEILETANGYFTFCLENAKGGEMVRDYLSQRGYTPEDIKEMELGFIPSQEQLFKYLIEKKGYDKETVREALILNNYIGSTHVLSIPYRSGGVLKGFKFRTLNHTAKADKYQNSTGLSRNEGFFNLSAIKGDKDLTIVEGELDALHATVKGIDNVVATGEASINTDQIADAKRRGAKSITICFDQEPGAENKVLRALETLREEEDLRVYVATLPDLGSDKTDPDRLIKEKGAEAFEKVIKGADPFYKFLFLHTWRKFEQIEEQNGGLTAKDKNNLLEEIVSIAQGIKRPFDRDQYKAIFINTYGINALGITPEAYDQTVEDLRYKKDKADQSRKLTRLLDEAKKLHEAGNVSGAIGKLIEKGREISGLDRKSEYEKLLEIPREGAIMETIQGEAESIETGYTLRDHTGSQEELSLPSGALSIVAGRTSHRKTGLMLNLAINTATKYPTKEIHLFTYEESQEALLIKLMNIYINVEFKRGVNNLRYIKNYFKSGGRTYTNPEFLEGKERFFKELIYSGRLRVHYLSPDVDKLTGAIQYISKKANVGAIFVDYIQLIRIGGNFQSRQLQLQEICERLRETAINSRLPIILGAQFNRTVTMEGEIDSGNIREAGDIEQTANLVLGIWDRAFTKENLSGQKEHKDRRGDRATYAPGELYVEVLKGRDTPVGTYGVLKYNGNTGKIENPSGLWSQ